MDTNRAAAQVQPLGRGLFANELGIQFIVPVLAIFLNLHQIGMVQDPQMMRDLLNIQFEKLCQVRNGKWTSLKGFDDLQSDRIADGLKVFGAPLICLVICLVICLDVLLCHIHLPLFAVSQKLRS
jgi:hypothetical protein